MTDKMGNIEEKIIRYKKAIDGLNDPKLFSNYSEEDRKEAKEAERDVTLADLGRSYADDIVPTLTKKKPEVFIETVKNFCKKTLESINENSNSASLKASLTKLIIDGIKNRIKQTYPPQYRMLELSKKGGQRTPFEKRLKADLILLARSRKIHVTQSMSKSHIISLLRK